FLLSIYSSSLILYLFFFVFFFFKDPSTTEIYTLSLHDALPVVKLILFYYIRCLCSIYDLLTELFSLSFRVGQSGCGLTNSRIYRHCDIITAGRCWLGDRFNSFKILMYVFAGLTLGGILLAFTPSLLLYTIGCIGIAIAAGIGNGTIFKLAPLYFPDQLGIVNGIVSMMGGLGGFFPPIMLSVLFSWTGHYAIGFMLLSHVALASLILVVWMYKQDQQEVSQNIVDNTLEGIMVTDLKGTIGRVNPASTKGTGYTADDVIGKRPNVLQSGKRDRAFCEKMWQEINECGRWQGHIWNKKKNGDLYLEQLTISSVHNKAGEIRNYVGMFTVVDEASCK